MVPRFRCWDEPNKTMRFNDEIVIWSGQVYINEKKELDAKIKGFSCLPEYLMQSTGLKDKNGVEIYCGDIVSVRNHPFQKTEKSGAGIEIDGDYAISWNEGDLTWCAGNLLLARLKPYVTVAGNIYENPELLDQSNES